MDKLDLGRQKENKQTRIIVTINREKIARRKDSVGIVYKGRTGKIRKRIIK